MTMYQEKKPRRYEVTQLTLPMLMDASNLPGFLSEFPAPKLYPQQDCIVYYGTKNTVIRANNGQKIHPKVGDYLGVNSDYELRYWHKDDFNDFYERVSDEGKGKG